MIGVAVAEPAGLLDLVPARRGHFEYESGHHGDLWLDLDTLFLRPRRLQPYVPSSRSQVARHEPEVVCGPLVGGAFVAQSVAAELDIDFCYTARHDGRTSCRRPSMPPSAAGRSRSSTTRSTPGPPCSGRRPRCVRPAGC